MSSKTKIVVLHMKEIIYTTIFLILGILLIFILFFMFDSKNKDSKSSNTYQPGIYTSTVTLSNATLEVEVTVDQDKIKTINFGNLDETISTAYPLVEPAIEEISAQVYETQSLENITYSDSMQYTSQVILEAIKDAVDKAKVE